MNDDFWQFSIDANSIKTPTQRRGSAEHMSDGLEPDVGFFLGLKCSSSTCGTEQIDLYEALKKLPPLGSFFLLQDLREGSDAVLYICFAAPDADHCSLTIKKVANFDGSLTAAHDTNDEEDVSEISAMVLELADGNGIANESNATKNADVALAACNADELVLDAKGLADRIFTGFKQVQSEPVNMRILSGRLEGAGAALSTISQNYDKMAGEMVLLVEKLRSTEDGTLEKLADEVATIRHCLAGLSLIDNAGQRLVERSADSFDVRQRISENLQLGIARSCDTIGALGRQVPSTCRQVRRRINGLDVVKLLCRVESGRLSVTDGGLNGIIDRLEKFHNETDQNLAELSAKATQIVSASNAISEIAHA